MKKTTLAVVSVLVIIGVVALWNYTTVYRPVSQVLSSDPRNAGIEVRMHYQWFLNPGVLVYDLREVPGSKSPADVTRTLLQSAHHLKERSFDSIILSFQGEPRFMLTGDYFQTLGSQFGIQNPVYTLRTLPENIYTMEGGKAFSTWTGGLLGVTNRQMEDLNEFHRRWFMLNY